ncbi:hypothetical protein K438DRAFT_1281351 [Mycena galopus ATCC 62051]|nr:hypothetical protein K438DRAFT_1281351 [Mycena galopus ATCC 62051]
MLTDLEADRALVARIQARILDLEHSLAELRAEQVAAQERLDSYKYPVLILPNEITSEIFIHFLPPYPICPPVLGMFSPTHLTHICHRWRKVALATPALWRAIGPSNPDLDLEPGEIDMSKISDAWVNRSGSCPLSIEINEDETYDHPPSILSTLIPHRARWEYLTLLLNDHSQDALHLVEGPMPLLRHLRLSLCDHDPFEFRDLPQLRSVEVVGNSVSRLTLPWAQLTSLTLRGGRVRGVHCDFITDGKTCTLRPVYGRLSIYWDRHRSSMLEVFDVRSHFYDDEGTRGFLAILVVPALYRLEVQEKILGRNPIDSLASFITTSGCKLLQEIRITGSTKRRTAVEYDFRAAFPSIPTISFEIP